MTDLSLAGSLGEGLMGCSMDPSPNTAFSVSFFTFSSSDSSALESELECSELEDSLGMEGGTETGSSGLLLG